MGLRYEHCEATIAARRTTTVARRIGTFWRLIVALTCAQPALASAQRLDVPGAVLRTIHCKANRTDYGGPSYALRPSDEGVDVPVVVVGIGDPSGVNIADARAYDLTPPLRGHQAPQGNRGTLWRCGLISELH